MNHPIKRTVLGKAGLEFVELLREFGGEFRTEFGEVLFDLRDDGLPTFFVNAKEGLLVFSRNVETGEVERAVGGQVADFGFLRLGSAIAAAEDPLEDAAVVAVSGPEEVTVCTTAEPVDVEDLRELGARMLADFKPMLEVVAHVVTAERQHGERIEAELASATENGGGHFGSHGRAEEHTVFPATGFIDQRHDGLAAATEEERADWNAFRIFPFGSDDGALRRGRREAGVLMGGDGLGRGRPRLALPVDQEVGSIVGIFPPNAAVERHGAVGEDGVTTVDGTHGVGVGLHGRAGGDAEETVFGVDGVEHAILFIEAHPGDIVTDGLDGPAGDGGFHHGEVGLAAGGREGGRDIFDFAFGGRQLEDEHVFGHPAFAFGLVGGDTQREALLAEQGVAAVARAVGDDFIGFGEVRDVFLLDGGRRPRNIRDAFRKREANGVDALHEGGARFDLVDDLEADARHDLHGFDNVRGVGEFNTILGDGGVNGAHGEGDDIEGTTDHAAFEEFIELSLHFGGGFPMVRRAGIFFLLGADVCALFDAGNVGFVRTGEVGVGRFVEFDESAGLDHQIGDFVVHPFRAVEEDDFVRRAEVDPVLEPAFQFGVFDVFEFHVLSSLFGVLEARSVRDRRGRRARCLKKQKKNIISKNASFNLKIIL